MKKTLFIFICVSLFAASFYYCVDPEEALVKVANETSDTLYVSLQTGTAIAELDNDSSKWIYSYFHEVPPGHETIIGIIYSNDLKEKRKLYVIKKESLCGRSLVDYIKQIRFDFVQEFSHKDLADIGYNIRIHDI